ncbi:MAG: hypothetical protein OEO83_08585 [Alphaproteobacteria bacterium]|nr:hypothetical protein [Alphaproteobacteria bacterium]
MADQITNWVMSYVERWDKLTNMEYGIVAACVFGMIIVTIITWKIYRCVEAYLYRRYQLHGWQENRGKAIQQ